MKKIITILVSVVLVMSIFTVINKSNNGCATVYVDYGKLNNGLKETKCIDIYGSTDALSLLSKANYIIEGTREYGQAVVCRVNGLPDKSVESCDVMPPAKAYWAVIIKKNQTVPLIPNEWGWAQKGINETYLSPGDKIGLVFSTEEEVRWP